MHFLKFILYVTDFVAHLSWKLRGFRSIVSRTKKKKNTFTADSKILYSDYGLLRTSGTVFLWKRVFIFLKKKNNFLPISKKFLIFLQCSFSSTASFRANIKLNEYLISICSYKFTNLIALLEPGIIDHDCYGLIIFINDR